MVDVENLAAITNNVGLSLDYGGKDGWQGERCYMMADEVERAIELLKNERRKEDHTR